MYSHLVIGWGSYSAIGSEAPSYTYHYTDSHFHSYVPSPPLPSVGEATYDLEGRGWLTHFESNIFKSASEVYEVVMSGELNANFGVGELDGYPESDYGYKMTDGTDVVVRLDSNLTRAKYFGDGVDSE